MFKSIGKYARIVYSKYQSYGSESFPTVLYTLPENLLISPYLCPNKQIADMKINEIMGQTVHAPKLNEQARPFITIVYMFIFVPKENYTHKKNKNHFLNKKCVTSERQLFYLLGWNTLGF